MLFRSGLHLDLAEVDRVVRLDPARESRALDGFGPQIIERLDAKLPRAEVEHQQIPFLDIGGDEEVEGLRLVDDWGAVACQFQYTALVDLETGLEDVLFLLGPVLDMLARAALHQDGDPRP